MVGTIALVRKSRRSLEAHDKVMGKAMSLR